MTDMSTPHFIELKQRAAERAEEILRTSFNAECDHCRRGTWHYLVAEVGNQQIYRCAGCQTETAYMVQP